MSDAVVDDFLAHYGVKGMKWGQRRAAKKEARLRANTEKATKLIDKALKDPDVLINLNNRMVVTGKEFTQHMANGGLLDVKTSRVYAELDRKNKTYVLQ